MTTQPKSLIETQGIKYTGSKLRLLPYILENVGKSKPTTVLDGFAGTTRVSQSLNQNGYTVLCNDLGIWSEVFGTAFLLNKKEKNSYISLIKELNNVTPLDGWFSENYGGFVSTKSSIQADGKKRIWQLHVTKKLDAIRAKIDELGLNKIEKAVALTSLILALDKVDSTLGHQVSYLKEWATRAYKPLVLEIPNIPVNNHKNYVYNKDIFQLLVDSETPQYDLAYYDPPYGSNNKKMPASRVRYQSYYHLWKTVILNDEPDVFGAANRREDSKDLASINPFEDFRINPTTGKYNSVEAIGELIRQTQCENILLSYATDGKEMLESIKNEISLHGKIKEIIEIDYKRHVMASMRWTNAWIEEIQEQNKELIFIIKK